MAVKPTNEEFELRVNELEEEAPMRKRAEEPLRNDLYTGRTLKLLGSSEERFRSVVENANDAIICIDSNGNIDSWNQAATKIFGYSANEALGKPLILLIPERFRGDYQRGMNRIVSVGKSNIIGKTVYIAGLRKDGSEFPGELSVATWKTKGQMFFTGIVRDITKRKQAEEALQKARNELEQLVRKRTAELVKANEQLRCEIEDRKRVEEALRENNELLEKIFSTTHMLIAYMDTDFNFIRVNRAYAVADGREPEFFVGKNHFDLYSYEDNRSLFRRVVEKGEPHTAYAKPFEYAEHPERGVTYWDWTLHPVKKNSGKVEGLVLSLVNVTERIKTEERLRFLSSQLLTAQENERKRIAHELHDSIGQSLTAIKFGLENCLDQRDLCTDEARVQSLKAVIPLVRQAIEEARRIHSDLRPAMLDDLGILATINWFCREFQIIYSDLRIEKQVHVQEDEVPETLKMVIFRVLQEAMNNIAKHSEADLVRLCFKKTDATIGLTIEDNGRGFDPESALSLNSSERGFGITSMKERTKLTGGSFAINSTPGGGTVVQASWPYKGNLDNHSM